MEALIVPPAIDPGKPSKPTPPGQARLYRQDNQRARKVTGNMEHAKPSLTLRRRPAAPPGRVEGRREDQGKGEGCTRWFSYTLEPPYASSLQSPMCDVHHI